MEYNPFPRSVQLEVTAQMVQKWIKDEALQDFLDYLTIANPCVLSVYLTEREELFEEWVLSGEVLSNGGQRPDLWPLWIR